MMKLPVHGTKLLKMVMLEISSYAYYADRLKVCPVIPPQNLLGPVFPQQINLPLI